MQVKSIAECSNSAILLTFIKLPFGIKILFLRGRFTQVLLYIVGLDLGANILQGY